MENEKKKLNLADLAESVIMNKGSNRGEALRDKTEKFIIDTVLASDTDKWETAISTLNTPNWTIVKQYKNKEEAENGHKKWIKLMEKNPETKLEDINLFNL